MKNITCIGLVLVFFTCSLLSASPKKAKVWYMGEQIHEGQMVGSNIDLSKADYKNLIEPDGTLAYAAILSAPLSSGRRNAIIAKFKRAAEDVLEAIHKDADTVNRQMGKGSISSKRALLKKFNKDYFKKATMLEKRLEKNFRRFFSLLQKKSKITSFKKIKIQKFHTIMTKDGFGIAELKGAIKSRDWTKKKSVKEAFIWDTRVWFQTMFPPDNTYKSAKQKEIRNILIRTFVFLSKAGFKYRNAKDKPWKPFKYPTSTILSHSGRVLVGIKKSAKLDLRAITNWLVSGKSKGRKQLTNKLVHFKSRTASTHKTLFAKGKLVEKKVLANLKNNYAFNLPLGGYGSVGADGSGVRADGRFAHYLIILNDASKRDKIWQTAFQLGVEPTEPIFFTKPYACKGHLGTVHKLGGSEDMSIMNTIKWKDLSKKRKTVPANYDCMRIEIDNEAVFKAIAIEANKIINMTEAKQKKVMKKVLLALPVSGI